MNIVTRQQKSHLAKVLEPHGIHINDSKAWFIISMSINPQIKNIPLIEMAVHTVLIQFHYTFNLLNIAFFKDTTKVNSSSV